MAVKKESAFQKYPGQIVLGVVFVLCLILSLVNVGLEGDTKGEIDATNALAAKLHKKVASKKTLITPPAAPAAARAQAAWETAPETAAPRPWAFNRKPTVKVEVEVKEDPRKVLAAPAVKAIDQKDYEVTLSWEDAGETTAKITGYNVYRWVGDEKKPEKPVNDKPLAAGVKSFSDDDYDALKPFAAVHYAVTALTAEETRSGKKESPLSEAKSIVLPDDRSVLFYGKKSVEFAFVTVKRFHEGEYVTQEFMTYLGDPIGKAEVVTVDGVKARVDFTTDYILAYIGKEVVERVKTRKVQMRDATGKLQFGPNGMPLFEVKKTKYQMPVTYILISDKAGKVTRLDELEKPKAAEGPPPAPPANADKLTKKVYELTVRRIKAREEKAHPQIVSRLGKRIAFLKKNRRKIIDSKTKQVKGMELVTKTLLYDMRWAYLKANDKAEKSASWRRKALLLGEQIKDLESLLDDEAMEREREEWQLDRDEFREKKKGK